MKNTLWESEEHYRTLVEESFDGVFIQKGTKIVFANQRLNDMLGLQEGEMEGMDHWLIYHPDYQELTRERAQARMMGKNPSQYEVKLLRKDGSSFERDQRQGNPVRQNQASRSGLGTSPSANRLKRRLNGRKRTQRKSPKRIESLAEIGRIISSTPKIEEVYERFAEEVRKLIRFERLAVNLITKDQTISMAYTTGLEVAERSRHHHSSGR
jgi:PAS domain S-box-containing protein